MPKKAQMLPNICNVNTHEIAEHLNIFPNLQNFAKSGHTGCGAQFFRLVTFDTDMIPGSIPVINIF